MSLLHMLTTHGTRLEICLGLECSILQHRRRDRLVNSRHKEDEARLCKALSNEHDKIGRNAGSEQKSLFKRVDDIVMTT